MEIKKLTPEEEKSLKDSLKRCSQETIDAAIAFRTTGDVSKIPTVVLGIIAKFVEPEKKSLLENPADDMVLAEELSLDSISMLEIALCVEGAMGVSISNEELQSLRTYGDVKAFIAKKVGE
ncbi:MAG: acyl carrier protein [Opitutales bacterium]|nr:acyl carrier protein [Opitutales bacterium]